jgi:hypothetical protein
MNEKTRSAMLEKTIKVYRENAAALMAIIPVIEKFDGKVFNRRFENAMNVATMPDGIKCHFNTSLRFATFEIEVYNYNRSYKHIPDDPNEYACTGYITNERAYCTIESNIAFRTNAAGNYTICAPAIIEAVKKAAAYNEEKAAEIEKAIEQRPEMVEFFRAIAAQMKEFNDTYSSTARNLLGIKFELRYSGDSETRDYLLSSVW